MHGPVPSQLSSKKGLEEYGSRRAPGQASESPDVSQSIDCGFADCFYEWHLEVWILGYWDTAAPPLPAPSASFSVSCTSKTFSRRVSWRTSRAVGLRP